MFIVLYLLAVAGLGTSVTPKKNHMKMYQPFTLPPPLQVPDDEFIIKDISTFARNHSRSETDTSSSFSSMNVSEPAMNKTALRLWAVYIEHDAPKLYLDKMWGLIKHILYAAQDRLKYLQAIIDKYRGDRSFRAGFIFTKLDQLMLDSRRIYTFAARRNPSIYNNIILFRHLAKKNIDITYIVEYMFTFHEENLVDLEKLFASFQTTPEM